MLTNEQTARVSTITRSLVRNGALSALGSGLPAVALVLSVPYLLHHLGSERFGLVTLILAVLAYTAALNLGLGKAVTQRVARSLAEGDHEEVVGPTVWTATVAQVGLGLLGGAVIVGISSPLVDLMDFTESIHDEAVWSIAALGIVIPFILAGTTFRGLLEATGMFGRVNAVAATSGALLYGLPVAVVASGYGVIGIVLSMVAGRILTSLAYMLLALSAYPGLSRRVRFSPPRLRGLIAFGGWVAISDVIFPMFTYLDRFLVGAMAGMQHLAAYAIPQEIINRLWLVPSSLTAAVFPAVSGLKASEHRQEISRIYAHSLRLLILAVFPGAAILVLFSHEILSLWIGSEMADKSANLLRIFTIGLVVNSTAMLSSAILSALGFPRLRVMAHLIELPVYLTAFFVAVPALGVTGAAWAWVARMITTATVILWLSKRKLGLGLSDLIQHKVLPTTSASIGFFVLCFALAPELEILWKAVLTGTALAVTTLEVVRLRKS